MKATHIILTLAFITACNFTSLSQSTPQIEGSDTLVNNLKELVVEGKSQKIIEEGVSYSPDKNARKFAMDAVDLLSRMAIPQLIITADNIVQTMERQNVKIYIDYAEATPEDLSGLRPSDVKRVDVLEYPSDVRFHHAEHVVNFIMRKYEWGGYTKLSTSGRLLNDDHASGSLYSKFSHKHWTFDVNGNGMGTWSNHGRQDIQESFRDFSYDGTHFDAMTRIAKNNSYKGRDNSENAGFRAKYRQDDMTLSHLASFSRDAMPLANRYSKAEFSNSLFPTAQGVEYSDYRQLGAWIVGDYYFSLPAGNSFNMDWTMGFQNSNTNRDYRLGDMNPILNGEKSLFYYPQFKISYSKKLRHNNSLGATVTSRTFIYDITYTGSADRKNKIITSDNELLISYRQKWNFRLRLTAMAGAYFLYMKENGNTHTNDWKPSLYLRLDYSLNEKNSFALSGCWYSSPELHGTTSDVTLRENELLWERGNPNLKSNNNKWCQLRYNCIPNDKFSLTAAAYYYDYKHLPVYDYSIQDGYDGIVRSYSSDNREQQINTWVSAGIRLFNRALTLNGYVRICHQRISGLLDRKGTFIDAMISAGWYYKNFSAHVYYNTPSTTMFRQQGVETRQSDTYGLDCSYSIGEFRASFQFSNWFSQGNIRSIFNGQHYSSVADSWYRSHSRSIALTLSYTFPYGKKIERGDEFDASRNPAM